MQGVVDRERALYEREKVEREEARKKKWVERLKGWKAERRALENGGDGWKVARVEDAVRQSVVDGKVAEG